MKSHDAWLRSKVDRPRQYLITYVPNGSCIGLTDRGGHRLNGKETEFFIARSEGGAENSCSQSRPDGQGSGVAPGSAGHSHSDGSFDPWAGLKGKQAF